MPPVIPTRYLEIGSVPLSIEGAWRILDYTPLLQGRPKRGDDRIVPGAAGRTGYDREYDEVTHRLRMDIFGWNDETGAAHPNKITGLEANVDYLNDNVVDGLTVKTATLHLPGGNRTGSVYVEDLILGERKAPTWIRAALVVTIPAGRLT